MTQRANGARAETRGGTTYAGDETKGYTRVVFRMMSPHRMKSRRVTKNPESSHFIIDNKETLREIEATKDGIHDLRWCREVVDISEIRI